MKDSYLKGLEGEQKALEYLKEQGIRPLHTRWRGGEGEVDIVCVDGDTLVMAEVKYRPEARLGEAVDAVDGNKVRRLRSAARAYLARCPFKGPLRFDILEITRAGVWHVKGLNQP